MLIRPLCLLQVSSKESRGSLLLVGTALFKNFYPKLQGKVFKHSAQMKTCLCEYLLMDNL